MRCLEFSFHFQTVLPWLALNRRPKFVDHRRGLGVTSLLLTQRARVRSPVGSIPWLRFFPGFSLNRKTNVRIFGQHFFSVIIWPSYKVRQFKNETGTKIWLNHRIQYTHLPYLHTAAFVSSIVQSSAITHQPPGRSVAVPFLPSPLQLMENGFSSVHFPL